METNKSPSVVKINNGLHLEHEDFFKQLRKLLIVGEGKPFKTFASHGTLIIIILPFKLKCLTAEKIRKTVNQKQ